MKPSTSATNSSNVVDIVKDVKNLTVSEETSFIADDNRRQGDVETV